MGKFVVVTLTLGVVLLGSISRAALAVECGPRYSPANFAGVLEVSQRAGAILSRMQELAAMSATGVFSVTQRMALQLEFAALRTEITRIGDRGLRFGSRRTNEYLNRVIDANFLGLTDLQLNGATILQSQALGLDALIAVGKASLIPLECL